MAGVQTAKCPDCGCVRVAKDGVIAAECPMCGPKEASQSAPPSPPRTNPFAGRAAELSTKEIVGYLIAAGIVLFGLYQCRLQDSGLTQGNRSYNDNWYRIRDGCRTAIGAQLHDKNSAEWGDETPYESGTTFIINYELRAKNGFGAYRLLRMVCKVDKTSLRVISTAELK